MSSLPFDVFEGAICAYLAAEQRGFIESAFDDAIIEIQTVGPIDEYAVSDAISAVAKQCRRLYALIKYGSPRRRLSKQESRECKPDIERDERRVRFDFRPLLGRLWKMAEKWTEPPEQTSLFKPMLELFKERTTRLGEANTRDLFKHLVSKTAMVVATIGVVSAVCFHAVEWHKDNNQTKIALTRMYIEGGTTTIEKSSREILAAQIDTKITNSANILTEFARDDPVLTFVGAQIEQFRPALFEAIASSGGGSLNAVDFNSAGAAHIAKRAKQNARKGIGMWTTVAVTS